uniref:Uncharacterized protein n=1 Tax=Paramoeba aestuarina TaxID=180227 RepID=A0A7S4KPV9_9EUKA
MTKSRKYKWTVLDLNFDVIFICDNKNRKYGCSSVSVNNQPAQLVKFTRDEPTVDGSLEFLYNEKTYILTYQSLPGKDHHMNWCLHIPKGNNTGYKINNINNKDIRDGDTVAAQYKWTVLGLNLDVIFIRDNRYKKYGCSNVFVNEEPAQSIKFTSEPNGDGVTEFTYNGKGYILTYQSLSGRDQYLNWCLHIPKRY